MKCFLLCFILGACVIFGSLLDRGFAGLIEPECGLSPIRNRVAGGQDATENTTPWMVFLHNSTNFICGGSLIAKAYVLTAAHCVSPTPKPLIARLGEYDWGPEKPCIRRFGCIPSERDYNVSYIYTHPKYKTSDRDDIAILKLTQEVRYTANVRPICLVKGFLPNWQKYVATLRILSINGWGATKNNSLSHVLKTANLTQVDITTCRKQYKYPVDSSHICAGDPQQYACKGDSGGPLGFMVPANGTDYYVQVGVVSKGWLPCRGVSVFANVLNYTHWIDKIIQKEKIITIPRLVNSSFVQQNRSSTVPMKQARFIYRG